MSAKNGNKSNRAKKRRKAVAEFSFPVSPFLENELKTAAKADLDLPPLRYSGTLVGASVWVDETPVGHQVGDPQENLSSSDLIYRYGCFGKGSMSRSKPGDLKSARQALRARFPNVNLVTRRHEVELEAQRQITRDHVCLYVHGDTTSSSASCSMSESTLAKYTRVIDPGLDKAEEAELASFRERERSPEIEHEDTLMVLPATGQSSIGETPVFHFAEDDDWGSAACSDPLTTWEAKSDVDTQAQADSTRMPVSADGSLVRSPASSTVDEPMTPTEEIADASSTDSDISKAQSSLDQCRNGSPRDSDLPVKQSNSSVSHGDPCTDEELLCPDEYHLPFRERLVLSLEEAFFLHFALGCLDVHQKDGCMLSTDQLWKVCCGIQATFLDRYVVYHYFRAKGWACRPGMKFGMDFLLYRTSPQFFHSEYGVVIAKDTGGENKQGSSGGEAGSDGASTCTTPDSFCIGSLTWPLSWRELIRLNRVGESVSKTIILAVVNHPAHRPGTDAECFPLLRQFSVQV